MARDRGTSALAAATSTGGQSAATQRMRVSTNGPHDAEALDAEFTPPKGTVDFGAVKVPVPAEGSVAVEPSSAGRMQAVHVSVPEGRLSVSALAAPRNGGLWPDLATEIDASLREGGARVRSFSGEWGRELHATTDGATSVFVGVDGPRWMLYGVATGPTRDAVALDARLRRMLRGTVVVRGKAPYPVRTVLPLTDQPQLNGEGHAAPSAAPTMTLRTSLTNGAASDGAAAAKVGPARNGTARGASPAALRSGTETHGAPYAPAARGASTHGRLPFGAPTNDADAYGPPQRGPATDAGSTHRRLPFGAPTNGSGVYGAPQWAPQANGASTDDRLPFGAPTNGADGYGTPRWGPPPQAAAPDAAAPDRASTSGWNLDRSPRDTAPPSVRPPADRSGAADGAGPASTGGHSRRGVPAGWAHETGSHRRGSAAEPLAAEPPQATGAPAHPSRSGRPWVPSAPTPALPTSAGAESAGLTPPATTQRSSAPVDPAEWRPHWADPDPGVAEPAAPVSSPPSWDPLFGPLTGGLDPLPDPRAAWSDVVAGHGAWRQAEPAVAEALPDAGTPLYDAASSGGWSRSAEPSRRATLSDAGTPLFDAASRSGGSRRAAEFVRQAASSDAGTPLFDAASRSGSWRRSAERGGRAAPPEAGALFADLGSATGGPPRSAEPVRHAARPDPGGFGPGEVTAEPGGRRRRDRGDEALPQRATAPDAPARRARRHREDPSLAPSSVPQPPVAADGHRPGRRRAAEPSSTGRHDAVAVSTRLGQDAHARHADAGSRHAAQPGPSPRVPPTQWAWPKEPAPDDRTSNGSEPTGRRAADTRPTSWSAAELLDVRSGGRGRRSESARHGHPDDLEPGRHHRP